MDSHLTFDLSYFPLLLVSSALWSFFFLLLCLFSGWTRTSFSLIEYPALIFFGFYSHFEGLCMLGIVSIQLASPSNEQIEITSKHLFHYPSRLHLIQTLLCPRVDFIRFFMNKKSKIFRARNIFPSKLAIVATLTDRQILKHSQAPTKIHTGEYNSPTFPIHIS